MNPYALRNTDEISTPALVYYRDIFLNNTDQIIDLAGGADRLWPHVKSHKSIEMVKLQMTKGIRRFKCATVAEAEMVCMAGADAAILAMPPAGPVPKRLMALSKAFPNTKLYALADCEIHLNAYAAAAAEAGTTANLLVDVNMGMDRTGIPTAQVAELYRKAAAMPGLCMCGFHCYDGDRHEHDAAERQTLVDQGDNEVFAVRKQLMDEGFSVDLVVLGGSPSFPCHTHFKEDGIYYSPGTVFLNDAGYSSSFQDLKMTPAVTVMSRVISRPNRGLFTLDLGYKAIAGDPPMESRGVVVNVEHCKPFLQNEEHWVFRMDEGYEDQTPEVGTVVYVIPQHVCPCAALYPSILIAEQGELVDEWEVTARNRKITY